MVGYSSVLIAKGYRHCFFVRTKIFNSGLKMFILRGNMYVSIMLYCLLKGIKYRIY